MIKKGDNYDVDILDKERDRIATLAKNDGYFKFSKEYVYDSIDSSLGSKQMDVYVNVKQVLEPSQTKHDSMIYVNHKKYSIRHVFIYPDYNSEVKDTVKPDTLSFSYIRRHRPLTYVFIYNDKLKYKPKTLSQAVFIANNGYYNIDDSKDTYTSLSGLRNFKFINIDLKNQILNPEIIC